MQDLEKVLLNSYQIMKQDPSRMEVALQPKQIWPFYQGHFPQKPVLPAYAIAEISVFLSNLFNASGAKLSALHTLRMRKPVQPEDRIQITIEKVPVGNRFSLTWHLDDAAKTILASVDLETT